MAARVQYGRTKWRERAAVRLANERISLTMLTGGGAIADFRLIRPPDAAVNTLWEAPWTSLDPAQFEPRRHTRIYGPAWVGKFLASFTGHVPCIDVFGAPSDAEIRQGLTLHGEATALPWKVRANRASAGSASVTLGVRLPAAQLDVERTLQVQAGESVVLVEERVSNRAAKDHFFHWVQHATFGPPLLAPGESLCAMSGERAKTWPLGYEGKEVLADDREFSWPHAPLRSGGEINIAEPFVRDGTGFVVSVLMDNTRETGFVAALNWRLGVVMGYLFRRADFPWVAIWEENLARAGTPWNGKTRARGLEFGTTPMPIGKQDAFRQGPLFGTPTHACVPARGSLQTAYAMFVTPVGRDWRTLRDVRVEADAIVVEGGPDASVRLPMKLGKKLLQPLK